MSEYMLGIFTVSLVLGVLETVSYKARGGGGEKLAFAVLLAFAVISPIEELLEADNINYPVFSPEDFEELGEYEEKAAEAFEEGIEREISSAFKIDKEYIKVRAVGFSFKEMKAEKILVTLSLKAASADPKRVEEYISEFDIGECEVNFEIG